MTSLHGIQAEAIQLSFGSETVLVDLSFRIEAGAFVSLVGPSGCGKTSMLRLIAGLQEPTAGELRFSGTSDESPRVAYVFQEPRLLPWRTVRDNIRLPLELLQGRRVVEPAVIDEVLEMVGLQLQDADKFPRQLSGGMRMRVSLARAMVQRPQVLLLDEPFAALDDLLRRRLNQELLQLWQDQRWTAVFVTHNVDEAVFLSEQVHIMSSRPGRIVATVPIPLPRPRTPELRSTAEFSQLTGRIHAAL